MSGINNVYILSAVRTPMGRFLGSLSDLSAPQLGSIVIKEAIARAGLAADQVQEVIMGCVLQAGIGQNPARQAVIFAGLPPSVPAVTINKVCGSGLKSCMIAASEIRAGEADIVVAGGMESMSNAPFLIPEARKGVRLGHARLIDHMVYDGLWDVYNDFHMGETCELVADKYNITRQQMDEYALESHRKAVQATKSGQFKDEIVPITLKGKKGETITLDKDEGPREDSTLETLAKLKPVFRESGRLTAGNSSSINDGAAALVLISERKLKELGKKPLARITGYAAGGVEPKWVMMAPIEAFKILKTRFSIGLEDVDLIEINEAFAGATCALMNELKIPPDKLNVNGGAVALGHPIGCSGARILTTMIYALKNRGLKKGIAALCLGGGNSVAMSIELV